jgi:iron complex transport system substrate-binding protein
MLLSDAQRAIQARHSEYDLGLNDVAVEVGCSTRELQRAFREVGETGFRSYLLTVRMERAHRLLSRKKHGLTVRATAREVGYRQASGLRQAFRRFYGYNPSEIQPEPPSFLGDLLEPEVMPPVELD